MEAREQNPMLMTEDEYLAFELEQDFRSEFVDGQVIVMAGASYYHGVIANNIGTLLNNQLRAKNCDTIQDTMRVQIQKKKKNAYRYPDVVVVCGTPQFVEDVHPQTVTNPILLIEILSPSTASIDRVQKLDEYQQIKTVQDYLIVAQSERRVMHYQRQSMPHKKWLYAVYTTGEDVIDLPTIDCTLALREVYRRVQFEGENEDE